VSPLVPLLIALLSVGAAQGPAQPAEGFSRICRTDLTRLDIDAFRSPDAFFSPGYLWFWNDRLSREALSSQLREMGSCGAGTAVPLPMPKDFRPTNNVTALEPDYLTTEYFELYRLMLDEAAKLGMRVWLYDEGGWPSGSACGRVLKTRPDLAMRYLERVELRLRAGESFDAPEHCVCAFLREAAKPPRRLEPGRRVESEAGDVAEVFVVRHVGKPDLLNPETTRQFIRLTHDAYAEAVGSHLGAAISATFTDEPSARASSRLLPWTDGIEAAFQEKFGYDIRDRLPAIYNPGDPSGLRARIDFFDLWSERFAESYLGQIQRWCHEHGMLSSGHLGGDSSLAGAASNGHLLRCLRRLDIPGYDTIWRQIFPGRTNPVSPKFASSVIHQEGRPWAVTESFCVYGDGLTPAQMKWIVDYQYVRGTNLTVIGSYNLSTREYYMGGQRPLFGPCNPVWTYLDSFHTYVARLSYLLSLGVPCIDTALYYPIRDVWADGRDAEEAVKSHEALARLLFDNRCDFDFVDDDVLSRDSTRVEDGRLAVGPMRYRTICVGRSRWMSKESKTRLAEFAAAGGQVLWVDNPSAPPAGAVSLSSRGIAARIRPLANVVPGRCAIRVCKRALANGSLYFVTNEDIKPVHCTIRFEEPNPPVRIDPVRGSVSALDDARRAASGWSIALDLDFAGSCVLLFTDEKLPLTGSPAEPGKVLMAIGKGWFCRKVRAYRVTEAGFAQEDCPDSQRAATRLGDWRGALGGDFSGDAEYSVRFDCSAEVANAARWLDLGDVRCACRAFLNGEDLGKAAWPPFVFSAAGLIREGPNDLRVVVTNTLANQLVTTKVFDRWEARYVGPYHKRALGFERDSLPSGLSGPVTVRR